ncbi:MAG: 2-isopropylmalate synthase [Deltaproteobacteria bacterium CG03_land_8_20_14_0_80_45_14]|nr:MAG: 2-isopropylmalate synthase [Deltaproteobacteria bacterium CG03_land_8_20_14_0_80_45_14]
MRELVKIFDTTLRDGEQSPGATMNIAEKVRIAEQLEKLNVDIIEAGFPISSEGDFEAVKTISRTIKRSEVAALARTNPKDVDRAWEAVKGAKSPRLHIFVSTSDIHLKHQLKKSKEEVIRIAARSVARAKRYTPNIEFSAMDATRSDIDFLSAVMEAAVQSGATTINIPDTVGYAIPSEFGALIRTLRQKVRGIEKAILSVHCHNDLGLAVANSLVAVQNGARQVECTINGIGERAGNASLEEVVMAIRTRKDLLPFHTRVFPKHLFTTSRLVSKITGMAVQPNKAIVGANAFAHESGIHQDGILKEKLTYEIMTPESVGISKSSLVLGKLSGRHAFRERLKDLGYRLSTADLELAFRQFKQLADKKREIYDEDIESIVVEEILRVPRRFKLVYINVIAGNVTVPTATVQMEVDGQLMLEAGFGDGPVDATFKTIKKITRTKSKLLQFAINAITIGTEAQGEVTVKLEEKGQTVIGQGADTDVIVASTKAYINALNKMEFRKQKLVGM